MKNVEIQTDKNADNLNRKPMTHSITAFDRKYLAPKKRVAAPKEEGVLDDALFFVQAGAFAIVALFLFDAAALVMWAFSGQHPVDGFYVGSLTAHLIALF